MTWRQTLLEYARCRFGRIAGRRPNRNRAIRSSKSSFSSSRIGTRRSGGRTSGSSRPFWPRSSSPRTATAAGATGPRSSRSPPNSTCQIDSSTLDEFIVKIYGDTAVVWMSQHLVGPSKGTQLKVTFHYVDVFVLRDGRWQCVASQSTRVSAG